MKLYRVFFSIYCLIIGVASMAVNHGYVFIDNSENSNQYYRYQCTSLTNTNDGNIVVAYVDGWYNHYKGGHRHIVSMKAVDTSKSAYSVIAVNDWNVIVGPNSDFVKPIVNNRIDDNIRVCFNKFSNQIIVQDIPNLYKDIDTPIYCNNPESTIIGYSTDGSKLWTSSNKYSYPYEMQINKLNGDIYFMDYSMDPLTYIVTIKLVCVSSDGTEKWANEYVGNTFKLSSKYVYNPISNQLVVPCDPTANSGARFLIFDPETGNIIGKVLQSNFNWIFSKGAIRQFICNETTGDYFIQTPAPVAGNTTDNICCYSKDFVFKYSIGRESNDIVLDVYRDTWLGYFSSNIFIASNDKTNQIYINDVKYNRVLSYPSYEIEENFSNEISWGSRRSNFIYDVSGENNIYFNNDILYVVKDDKFLWFYFPYADQISTPIDPVFGTHYIAYANKSTGNIEIIQDRNGAKTLPYIIGEGECVSLIIRNDGILEARIQKKDKSTYTRYSFDAGEHWIQYLS